MINGTITLKRTGTSSSGTLYGQILWSAESNGSAKNTSTVTATVQVKRQAGFTTTGTWKGSLTVGGTTKEISWYGSISSDWVTVATITVDVTHANDGVGSCYIYAKVNGPSGTSQSGVYVSGSETIALEKIARFAVAVAFADFNDEANPVVQYSNPAGTEIQSLEAALSTDGSTAAISYRSIDKSETQYAFELTTVERNTLLSAASNSNTLEVYVLIKSSIAGTAQVSSLKAVMSVVNAAPALTPAIVDTNSATIALTGNSAILVALHSVASVKVNATAKKLATIKSVSITNGLITLTADGTLTPIAGIPITITVTDSRGNDTTYKAPNRVIPYIDPISTIENSMPNALGELDLSAKGMVFDGSFGTKDNAFSVKYRFKEGYGSYGSWISFNKATLDGNAFVAEASVTGLDYRKTYTFQVAVYDSIHTNGVLSAERKFVSNPVFDWSDVDFNFNVPVSMSGNKLTDIPTPTNNGDAIPYGYKDPQYLAASGGTMAGPINMNSKRITGLPEPSSSSDAATKKTVENAIAAFTHVEIKKLWANANPTSSFAAQTIAMDLSDYSMVFCNFRLSTEYATIVPTNPIPVGADYGAYAYGLSAGYPVRRTYRATATGVVFEEGMKYTSFGSSNVNGSNGSLIPVEVYGIKGVVNAIGT